MAQAFRAGLDVDTIHAACKFDPWFIREVERIVRAYDANDGIDTTATAKPWP